MNINELEELAKTVTGWSNCDKAWIDTSEDIQAAVVGHIDEDGNTYPVTTVDCDQYYAGRDSIKLAKFYAAANPLAILELIVAYWEAVSALKLVAARPKSHEAYRVAVQTLDAAKRLGVE